METKILFNFRKNAAYFAGILTIFIIICGIGIRYFLTPHLPIYPTLLKIVAIIILSVSMYLLSKNENYLQAILYIDYTILVFLIFYLKVSQFDPYVLVWYPPTTMSAIILGGVGLGVYTTLLESILFFIAYHNIPIQSQATIILSIIAAGFFGIIITKKFEEFAQENEMMKEYFYKLSTTDALTELYNRRYFFAECQKLFELAKRKQKPIALLSLDLDHFKQINDTYGHQRGDEVLKAFAQNLKKSLRTYDLVARVGGEEFAVCIYDAPLQDVFTIAQKIRTNIEKIAIDKEHTLSTSIGISYFIPQISDSMEKIILQADKALYKAKEKGRNRIERYEEIY